MRKVGKKNPEGRPQKGARKLTIDEDTWHYSVVNKKVLIWDLDGTKHIYYRNDVTEDQAVHPYDIRLFIDEHIRRIPRHEINAFIQAREDRIKKERAEFIERIRTSVYERAKAIVVHSNNLFQEYHGGDEIDMRNRAENKKFLEDLMWTLSYDATEDYHEATAKPTPKRSSWYWD
jgi:hypothetical protein